MPCRDPCSRSNEPQPSCGCSPADPGAWGWGRSPTSLGLAQGTTHGILRTLQRVGFVEQDKESGKYQLGATLLHLGTSYLDVNELRSRAINWADALAARSGEAVRIGTPLERQVLVVHHVFRPDDTLQASTSARCCRCTPPRWARCCSRTTRGRRPLSRRPSSIATPGGP